MKKKLFKFLIAASVVMVFASVASMAATITIEENSEIINTSTGDVCINFASDVADTDYITTLVYIPTEANPGPTETNVVYIDQNISTAYSGTLSFKMKAGVAPGTNCKLLMGGAGVAEADAYEFTYTTTQVTVAVNKTGNGIAELSTDDESGLSSVTMPGSETVKLNVTPAMGYYISSITENGIEKVGSFDAYNGSTYTYVASKNTIFTVIFTEIAYDNMSEADKESTGMTGMDALTLPEVFRGKLTAGAAEDVSIAFGQVAPKTGKEVAGYGIYLTYENGTDVTTSNPNIGPKFAHTSELSGDNQFGIIFELLNPGNYNAQTYIEYTDGSIVLGIKVPFTVE